MATNPTRRAPARTWAARLTVLLTATLSPVLAQGCGSEDAEPLDEDVAFEEREIQPGVQIAIVSPDTWHVAARSRVATQRAGAADAIAAMPGAEGPEVLRQLIADPEPVVRGRAVLAYGRVLGREAVPLLKQTALTDPDTEVQQLALAAFGLVKESYPEPPRSWVKAELPDAIEVGTAFDVRVRFGSSEAAPRVKVFAHPPDGMEIVAPEDGRWSGALAAGREQTATFRLRATSAAATQGGVLFRAYVSHDRVDVDEVTTLAARDATGGE